MGRAPARSGVARPQTRTNAISAVHAWAAMGEAENELRDVPRRIAGSESLGKRLQQESETIRQDIDPDGRVLVDYG